MFTLPNIRRLTFNRERRADCTPWTRSHVTCRHALLCPGNETRPCTRCRLGERQSSKRLLHHSNSPTHVKLTSSCRSTFSSSLQPTRMNKIMGMWFRRTHETIIIRARFRDNLARAWILWMTLDLGTPASAIFPPSDSEVQILERKRGDDKSCSFDQLPTLRLGRYSHATI